MKRIAFCLFFTIALLLGSGIGLSSLNPTNAATEAYTAIGAKKPKNLKALKLNFVACSASGQLGLYNGPRKDIGTATFKKTLTATQAKNTLKVPISKPKSTSTNNTAAALIKGKIPFPTKKNVTTLYAEIDACGLAVSPTPTPTTSGTISPTPVVAVSKGSWNDTLRSTDGAMNLSLSLDRPARKLSFQVSVAGFPLGIVDAAKLPAETHEVTIPAGQNSAPFSFDSAFIPGSVSGMVYLSNSQDSFSVAGTITHGANAGGFAGTTASFEGTGAISTAGLGTVTISGFFPAGNNNFGITTNPG